MSRTTRTIHAVLAAAAAIDEADSRSAALAAISSSSLGAAVPRATLETHLQGSALTPGLGKAILQQGLPEHGGVDLACFLRMLDRICCPEDAMRRCEVMYDVLSSLIPHAAMVSVADSMASVLQHCFVLDSAHPVAHAEPFRCAAAQAAIMTGASAWRRGFAEYVLKHLPGMVDLLRDHVLRMCAASDGLDAATLMHEAAQRKQGVSAHRELDIQALLRMPTDEARRVLAEHTQSAPCAHGLCAQAASMSAERPFISVAGEPVAEIPPMMCEEWISA